MMSLCNLRSKQQKSQKHEKHEKYEKHENSTISRSNSKIARREEGQVAGWFRFSVQAKGKG